MAKEHDPLTGKPPAEMPLKRAPLLRVIAQVRFPVLMGIETSEQVAPFQTALRNVYPVLRPEQVRRIVLDRRGQTEGPPSQIWRFLDRAQGWRASLGSDFLALETSTYSSRRDFLDRFSFLLRALVEHFNPPTVDRLGVRYIDRVSGEHVTKAAAFLRPEISGVLSTSLRGRTSLSLSEALLSPQEDASLRARWGLLPPNTTPDPSAIEPLGEPNWILDLDMFSQRHTQFDADALSRAAAAYAERIYAFFRWAVTEKFLATFGGER
jgi:uncharacterized protein (TIGR04255 family)